MAQVVIGAMGTLLPKLADLITKEYNLQRGVRGEIMFLKAEMESMETALLRISEAPIDQPPNIQVKLWAKAVRDLSYDLEDSIDKFMVRIETHGRPDKTHTFRNFIDNSLSLLTKGKIRHKIGSDIKDIKSRIKEVSERRDRYQVDSVASAKPDGPAVDTLRLSTLYKKATELVGTDEKSIEVIKMLTEGDKVSKKQLKVVSIVGFGGLGKTTLANAVYEKLKVQEDNQELQFDCSAFISVSLNPNMEQIFKSLLYQLDKHRIQNNNEALWGEEQLIREIRTFLENKRYLIVIDDLWDKSVWENIKYAFIENEYESRVITTTRILDVAQQAGGVYRLNPLSVVDSRKLFYQRIYDMENKSPPSQLVEVSENILKRCGGVPLAILTIGSLLSNKKGRAHTLEYWSKVQKSISSGLDNSHDDVKNMRRILSVSYSNLPPHLKTCLLHLSLYPEDYMIATEQLIWKWVGEGFVKKEQGKSLYEVGGDYLDELVNKNLVQPVNFDNANKVCSCRVHDMVRDLIISLSSEENFLTTIGGPQPEYLPSKIRRLSVQTCIQEVTNQLSIMGLTHVRSLTVSSPAFSLLPTLSGFPVLRVLDLTFCKQVDNNYWRDICSLFHLRYLSLKGTSITRIPKEIENLQFLQVLDIRCTKIEEELPSTFIQLTQLLLFCMPDSITCAVPRWMCSMYFLFALSITLETLGEEDLHVLGNLPSLSELYIQVEKPTHGRDKLLVIDNAYPFRCLKRFSVKDDTMKLKFARGAMQSLNILLLGLDNVHDTLLQFGDLVFGLENLSLLEHIVVALPFHIEDTETQKVRNAVQKQVDMNQNKPILTITYTVEMYMCQREWTRHVRCQNPVWSNVADSQPQFRPFAGRGSMTTSHHASCFPLAFVLKEQPSAPPPSPPDVQATARLIIGRRRARYGGRVLPKSRSFLPLGSSREVRMTDLFSGIQAAMVINRVENSDQSPEDWVSDEDGSGGSTGLPGAPCFTSRLSLLKVGSVVAKFSSFKRQLVMDTGFGGFLEVKAWQKINLKYSAFLMDRVDAESSKINLEAQGVLDLCEQKLNYVFGIPAVGFDINGEGVEPSEACIEYTRMAATFSDKGTHSLKAAENVLLGAISESSPQIQQDCFKIAFVIFIIGHVLAPTSKHDYISIDFWAALNDISKTKSWNWGRYVLKHLFQAVRKFKADVSKRNPTIHIVGCHLFLQIFVLDCLDLGILNKPREITPRIGLYDYESMRKMVEKIAVNISPGEISYHGGAVRPELSVSQTIELHAKGTCSINLPKRTTTPKRASTPSTPMLRCNYTRTGPQEFSNYIRTKYPSISAEKLGILLREQNARGLANISEMRQAFQTNMFTFTDKLMTCLAESCTCCKALGHKSCILNGESTTNCQPHPTTSTDHNQFSTPLVSKVGPRLPAPGNHEGAMSATSTASRKREGSISSSLHSGLEKKPCSRDAQPVSSLAPTHEIDKQSQMAIAQDDSIMEIASTIASMHDDLTAILVTHYAEIRPSPEFILFGSTTEGAPLKIDLPKCNFGRDPWVVGTVSAPPPDTALRAIRDWMAAASTLNLQRPWVVHPKPRFISMEGLDIQQQLVSQEKMSHEMFTSIFRRLAQLDMLFSKDTPGMIWRKYIEPDFATTVLSNADPLTVHSIRASFQEGTASCNPASCRMWFIPAILPDGWVVYAFDMLRKRIIVFDPAVGPFGYSNRRVSMHEFVSNKLHAALFNCLYSFFSSWHCESSHWKRTFPIIMTEQFHKDEAGLCATFFARNYDGDKLQIPLNKETIVSHSNLMLYELMRMQGNQTKAASDSLEAIKGSFVVL